MTTTQTTDRVAEIVSTVYDFTDAGIFEDPNEFGGVDLRTSDSSHYLRIVDEDGEVRVYTFTPNGVPTSSARFVDSYPAAVAVYVDGCLRMMEMES